MIVSNKNCEIDVLKLFLKNYSEYVIDMWLIGICERLVNEKRICFEDMYIMVNIFLFSNELINIECVSYFVFIWIGLYIIDF